MSPGTRSEVLFIHLVFHTAITHDVLISQTRVPSINPMTKHVLIHESHFSKETMKRTGTLRIPMESGRLKAVTILIDTSSCLLFQEVVLDFDIITSLAELRLSYVSRITKRLVGSHLWSDVCREKRRTHPKSPYPFLCPSEDHRLQTGHRQPI